MRYGIEEQLRRPPTEFADVIKAHFRLSNGNHCRNQLPEEPPPMVGGPAKAAWFRCDECCQMIEIPTALQSGVRTSSLPR